MNSGGRAPIRGKAVEVGKVGGQQQIHTGAEPEQKQEEQRGAAFSLRVIGSMRSPRNFL